MNMLYKSVTNKRGSIIIIAYKKFSIVVVSCTLQKTHS